MKKVEKLALKKLEAKKQSFENEKHEVLTDLLKNKSYETLYKQKQSAMIDFVKEPSKQNKKNLDDKQALATNLAKSLNKNSQILSQEYMCIHCKDKGFINDKPCSCLNQIISEMLMEDSGLTLDALNTITNNFEVFSNPEKMKKTYKTLEKWCDTFEKSQIKNWGFFGHTGTGKTHLMLHIMKKLIKNGYFVHFTTAFNLTQQLLSQHTNFEEKNRDYLSKYLECDVLFIDDMGTEPKYKNVNENYLYLILNQRMIEGKPIIFSSNFDISKFEDFYGERLFSRLINKRTSKSLWFDGDDLRIEK